MQLLIPKQIESTLTLRSPWYYGHRYSDCFSINGDVYEIKTTNTAPSLVGSLVLSPKDNFVCEVPFHMHIVVEIQNQPVVLSAVVFGTFRGMLQKENY